MSVVTIARETGQSRENAFALKPLAPKFVAEVERGYRFGLEDYRNDLDLRGIIAMLNLDSEVAELDRRFEAMLIHRDKRVWESSAAAPFWDFGYPSSTGTLFLDDIQNEGLS